MVDFERLAQQRCVLPIPLCQEDWLVISEGLTLAEKGAMISLLLAMWREPSGCILPSGGALANWAGVSLQTWRDDLDGPLLARLIRVPGGYSHPFIMDAIAANEAEAVAREASISGHPV